jgi:hypothetical protein
MNSVRDVASVMSIMFDAISFEAHHEIRLDEASCAIASVQGPYSMIFTCDGGPPSTVSTKHLPPSFVPIPGPSATSPQVRMKHM